MAPPLPGQFDPLTPPAEQLRLPFLLPAARAPTPSAPELVLPPSQLWASLPPGLRDRLRDAVLHAIQEALDDAD